jgi:hypothetical protein
MLLKGLPSQAFDKGIRPRNQLGHLIREWQSAFHMGEC